MDLNPLSNEYITIAVGSDFTISDDAILTIQRLFNPVFMNLWTVTSVNEVYAKNNMIFSNDYGTKLAKLMEDTYNNSSFSTPIDDIILKMLYVQGAYIIKTCIDGAIQSAKIWYSLEINSYDIYISVCNNENLKKIAKEKLDCTIFNDENLKYRNGDYIENVLNYVVHPNTIERGSIVIIYNMEERYKKWISDKIIVDRNTNKLTHDLEATYINSMTSFTSNFLNVFNTNGFTDVTVYNIFVSYIGINDPNVKEFVSKILYGFIE